MTDTVRISPRAVRAVAEQLDVAGASVTRAAEIDVPREILARPYVADSMANTRRVARAIGRAATEMSTDLDRLVLEADALDALVADRFLEKGWER
ncbi:hypothetical protein [Nocardioides sp. LHG3406-4]|uniref:hypothetical protein n=1 Tax=Nocardioides sp. LHG3406-4 TaxID=2804575 RepID=UPI003CF54C30